MVFREIFLAAGFVLGLTALAEATSITIGVGDDDGFGGTQGVNSNDGDPFTPFVSPAIVPGNYTSGGYGMDSITVSPWTPYRFQLLFGFTTDGGSPIVAASLSVQVGSVGRRTNGSGFGYADVRLSEPISGTNIDLGDLLTVDTGTAGSLAEEQVREITFDITAYIQSLPPTELLLFLDIDGSALGAPVDEFALDFATITLVFADEPTTTTTTSTTTTSTTTTTTTSTTTTTIPAPEALCGDEPRVGCLQAASGKASVLLSNPSDAARRKLKWKWKGGDAVDPADFGDPVSGSPQMVLCVYDSSADPQPLMQASIPTGLCGGAACWAPAGAGFKLKNKEALPQGITSATFKPGAAGKAQVKIGGKGDTLPLPTLGLSEPATVQLVIDDGAGIACWQTAFSASSSNDAETYKAKGP